jgi:hypothetical protein
VSSPITGCRTVTRGTQRTSLHPHYTSQQRSPRPPPPGPRPHKRLCASTIASHLRALIHPPKPHPGSVPLSHGFAPPTPSHPRTPTPPPPPAHRHSPLSPLVCRECRVGHPRGMQEVSESAFPPLRVSTYVSSVTSLRLLPSWSCRTPSPFVPQVRVPDPTPRSVSPRSECSARLRGVHMSSPLAVVRHAPPQPGEDSPRPPLYTASAPIQTPRRLCVRTPPPAGRRWEPLSRGLLPHRDP